MPCDNHRRLGIPQQSVPKRDPVQRVKSWDGTTPGLHSDKRSHLIRVGEGHGTGRRGVFAGGENVNGADLVVTALADGRRAAEAIHRYLQSPEVGASGQPAGRQVP